MFIHKTRISLSLPLVTATLFLFSSLGVAVRVLSRIFGEKWGGGGGGERGIPTCVLKINQLAKFWRHCIIMAFW